MNEQLSSMFRTMAAVMDIKGESVFKSIAFSKVARVVESLPFDLQQAVANDTLGDIQGVGESSRRIIQEFIQTGHSTDYEQLLASIPPGLIELLDIPSLGPKTVHLLWKQRGITSINELSAAIAQGKLEGIKGMGEKKIAGIAEGITLRNQASQRHGLPATMEVAESLARRVRELKGVDQVEIAGSLRRGRQTIGDVDLVCALTSRGSGQAVTGAFVEFPEVEKINGHGQTKASVVITGGLQIDLRIVPQENFGAALLYFTGSKDHNVELRSMAQDRGMILNEWGLYRLEDYDKAKKQTSQPPETEPLASKTEREIYRALKLAYIEPELRENRGEIEAAAVSFLSSSTTTPASSGDGVKSSHPAVKPSNRTHRAKSSKQANEPTRGALPVSSLPQLITAADIRGDLHTHTTASDGHASIEQMAEAAMAMGYEYLGISDHSASQVIAHGLSRQALLKHVDEIRGISDRLKPFRIFAGCEVDILADGQMDYEDKVLAQLDYVIGSPHMALKQTQPKATDRLIRAIENPYVTFIGHPTGRLIDRRAGLPLDFARIFQAAVQTGTVLEINAAFPRLDLDDVNARAALLAGCRLTINTDAHRTEGLQQMRWGLLVARRAWTTPAQVINCLPLAELENFFQRKRRR
ncbi:MAG: PHP domain-containing protein [Phycisphaerales bacterium]|nr:PHP domain-containing protein [Phycisphaerales bacterium]